MSTKKRQPLADMSWQEFGDVLISTEDLDPVYVMLWDAASHGLDLNTMKRFLLAYWCFYHCGVAAYIAESRDFYTAMWRCIAGRAPRGMERRYFWGRSASDTIYSLIDAGEPEAIVDHMTEHKDFWGVFNTVKSYTGFGPWMGFKVADMAERVLGIPVDFSTCTLGIYKDPRAGAAFIQFGDRYHPISDEDLQVVCNYMVDYFQAVLAPPRYERPCNIQEVETVLCKYKAHCYGAYPIGNDTHHVTKGMDGWGDLAQELRAYLPKEH